METSRYLLSILVDNEPGVLSRIAGLFSGRGFNIDSLSVASTDDPVVSRITMATTCDAQTIEQIKKQLHKLINVITVTDLTEKNMWNDSWPWSRSMPNRKSGLKSCASWIFSDAGWWMWDMPTIP